MMIIDKNRVPLPPKDADVLTTACAYCTVACGYKVYRWPLGKEGGRKAGDNALGGDFPNVGPLSAWASPNQHNIAFHEGQPHHVLVLPDHEAEVVNIGGNHSIRGGTLALKVYNPDTPTRDRLQHPMIRIAGKLQPVSWDMAAEVMAAVSKHVLDNYGPVAWGMKTYSYESFENTYAIAKLVDASIGTPVYAPHDKPGNTENAAGITGVDPALIVKAAEMIAKPRRDGSRPKTSFMLEKGNYWSNNYMNTASLAALGLICGAGNRPGRVISRGGGHQRGGMGAGGGRSWLSPEKFPGRRKKALNVDRWVMDGNVRFMWVIGSTWYPAMPASRELARRVGELTRGNPNQPAELDTQHIIDALFRRVDSGGMVLVDSDIYPVEPLNTEHADVVLPAATWGEEDMTRCNSERRLRLYSAFNDPPGEARPDWRAIAQFAKKMGYEGYDWKDSNDVFIETSRWSRTGVLSYHALVVEAGKRGVRAHDLLRQYGTTGIQTPIRVVDGKLVGTKRLHDPANSWGEIEGATNDARWLHSFDTQTGKANLLKSSWNGFPGWSDFYEAIKPRAEKGEIWVTNGRVNEAWQSGFDDRRKPYLAARWPYPQIVLNPADAGPRGIESGDFVEVVNDEVFVQTGEPIGVLGGDLTFAGLRKSGHIKATEGRFTAVAIVSDEIRPGVAKAQFAGDKSWANAVVHSVPDPVSGNYRYKLGRGTLAKAGESPFKKDLTRMSLKPRNIV